MGRIVLGKAGGKNVYLDLDVLLRTRLLIQANSGGGKSWLIRRLAETIYRKVQVIILDREGEFSTLREKFGYVLAGKGGETPVDARSAEMLAHRLLETGACAVLDLYEMKNADRHHFVALFLNALINSPKKLWHPVIIIIDEFHIFCPEKGEGESEAKGAVMDLATRGRKRGFCLVGATQRLAKVDKSASAELINVLIGPTFQDIDLARAHKALGILRKDQEAFNEERKIAEHGLFYGLGRAISTKPLLFTVGEILTTHPEPGSAKYAASPPPTPQEVQRFLPKLADLPKEAEEKVRTEGELRRELRQLKADNKRLERESKKAPAAAPTVARPAVAIDRKAIEAQTQKVVAQRDEEWAKHVDAVVESYGKALDGFYVAMDKAIADGKKRAHAKRPKPPKVTLVRLPASFGKQTSAPLPRPVSVGVPAYVPPKVTHPAATSNGEWDALTPYQRSLLSAVADFEAIGQTVVAKTWVAARAKKSYKSSTFGNNVSSLRSSGFLDYRQTEHGLPGVLFTEEGRAITPPVDPPVDNEEMLAKCNVILTPYQQDLLRVAHEAYPEAVTKADLAERAGKSIDSSTFGNNVSSLRTAGMFDYPEQGMVKCRDWLFID